MERKVKYNYVFQLHCVEEVLKKHHYVNSVSKKNGFDLADINRWIDLYNRPT